MRMIRTIVVRPLLAFLLLCLGSTWLTSRSFGDDYFPAAGFNGTAWLTYNKGYGPLGLTDWGLDPQIVTQSPTNPVTFARFELHKYNPDINSRGRLFLGTEIKTNKGWGVRKGHVTEFEACMRVYNRQSGVITAFYPYQDEGNGISRNEIDYEILHKQLPTSLWLNLWRNGSQLGSAALQGIPSPPDWGDWVTYRIRRSEFGVQWLIASGDANIHKNLNFTPVRTITNTNQLPNQIKKLQVHFNIWVPETSMNWNEAYNPDYDPVATAGQESKRYLDVRWLKVRVVPRSLSATSNH